MELTNEFRVGVPVAKAWDVLTDVELIAPCLPGAELQEVEGDEYRGIVKVKVGPITAQYKGAAQFVEKDTAGHRAVLRAEGRDTRGQGNASATITATLTPDGGDATSVRVVTDLTVSGKVAQFGRGVLADVSAKLMDQFVVALEEKVLAQPAVAAGAADEAGPGAAETPPAAKVDEAVGAQPEPREATPPRDAPAPGGSGVRTIDSAPAQPVDLLDAAGGSVARRVGPAVSALVVIGWILVRWRRKRRR